MTGHPWNEPYATPTRDVDTTRARWRNAYVSTPPRVLVPVFVNDAHRAAFTAAAERAAAELARGFERLGDAALVTAPALRALADTDPRVASLEARRTRNTGPTRPRFGRRRR